ncbi:SRPBCC family protein [Amycolatopsis alkalitolerans]|uniref:SRPBCC domain-containing protein n=1 Tax=Amycolatopsis alkalitolerans TaxID=2547244 RepID=A0A5C4LPW6_9PSEU|nr:SRPBCC domain-containing protein [Amycolatopsis alkalitolerans]TNC19386.1 SRPBCC domain-containing protein [Amycolatopsis alkalitolerans]
MNDYERVIRVAADCTAVHAALTTTDGLSAWWTTCTGSGQSEGELKFWFDGPQPCVMHVEEATPSAVRWVVTDCDFLRDWVGTRPTFSVTPAGSDRCEIRFRHHGLTPELDCIEVCTQGWNHFIPSLRSYLETGTGAPYGCAEDIARRKRRAGRAAAG